MEPARDFAIPLALALFTEIDQRHLRFANDGLGLFGAVGPAAPRDPLLRQTLMHVGRQRHVHHFSDWSDASCSSDRHIPAVTLPADADCRDAPRRSWCQ